MKLKSVRFLTLTLLTWSGCVWAQGAPSALNTQIQKALNAVPGYTVFDYLSFKAEGGKVTLLGQVTTADLKNQAEKAIHGLAGVTEVSNNIAVVALSKEDAAVGKSVSDAVYRGESIYAKDHSIHVLVKNAEVTLEGTVHSEIDRTMIASAALGAGNVFDVTNHLVATAADSEDASWRNDMVGGPAPPPVVITPSVSPNADK
jgi:osmotically-inducible protein OsmY